MENNVTGIIIQEITQTYNINAWQPNYHTAKLASTTPVSSKTPANSLLVIRKETNLKTQTKSYIRRRVSHPFKASRILEKTIKYTY